MRSKIGPVTMGLLAGILLATAVAVQAGGGAPTVTPPAAGDNPANTPLYTAGTVLARIGQAVGVTVVAGSNVEGQRVLTPGAATTPANFEQQIADVARQLPPGTLWAKLMMPAPPPGRSWSGDDVIQFSMIAARLYGPSVVSLHPIGARTASAGGPAAGLSLLGQSLPPERAGQIAADLHLRPVYVVTNPNARPSRVPARVVTDQNPQEFQRALQAFLAGVPEDNPKRQHILDDVRNNPGRVRIITDADGDQHIEIGG